MSEQPVQEAVKKPLSTAQLGLSLLSFMEKFGLAVLIGLLELARIKQKKAENSYALEKTKAEVREKQDAVDKRMAEKSDRDVITDFLQSDDKGSGS